MTVESKSFCTLEWLSDVGFRFQLDCAVIPHTVCSIINLFHSQLTKRLTGGDCLDLSKSDWHGNVILIDRGSRELSWAVCGKDIVKERYVVTNVDTSTPCEPFSTPPQLLSDEYIILTSISTRNRVPRLYFCNGSRFHHDSCVYSKPPYTVREIPLGRFIAAQIFPCDSCWSEKKHLKETFTKACDKFTSLWKARQECANAISQIFTSRSMRWQAKLIVEKSTSEDIKSFATESETNLIVLNELIEVDTKTKTDYFKNLVLEYEQCFIEVVKSFEMTKVEEA
jgi:hypothetical protein